VSDFYGLLLGDVWSALGLAGVEGLIKEIDLPEEVQKFLTTIICRFVSGRTSAVAYTGILISLKAYAFASGEINIL
jgi:hypothetical protein